MNAHSIGRYRVTRKLGAGGMAEVYLAKHELIDRYAAVKLLLPEMSAQAGTVQRFFQEAQAAACIDHPGIVNVFDVGFTPGGRAYLAMEVLSGESLGRRLKRQGRLPLASAITLIRQLAGAIGAAHRRGIIHRDLKPDNVFLVPDPEVPGGERVKVLDFGLAKLLPGQALAPDLTAHGTVLGTPGYMAPEQCLSAARVDARADLYSIGCLLYACLCGQPPFGTGGIEVLLAHIGKAPVPVRTRAPFVPPELDALILRLLAKDPGQRVPSCEALIVELDRVLAALSGEAPARVRPPAPPPLPGTRPARALGSGTNVRKPGWPDTPPQPGGGGELDAGPASRRPGSTVGNGEIDITLTREGSRRILWSLAATGLLGGLVATGLAASSSEEQVTALVATGFRWVTGEVQVAEGPAEDTVQAGSAGAGEAAMDRDGLLAQAERDLSERAWRSALSTLREATEHGDVDERRRARVRELARRARAGLARERRAQRSKGAGRAVAAGKRESEGQERQILRGVRSAYARGNTALALERCHDARGRVAETDQLATFCGFVACKGRDARAARQYYAQTSRRRQRNWIAQTCLKEGVDIQN